jgi:hypothetical protein
MFAAREVSKLLPVGTIVLVYDKVSFVSAKSWAQNAKLKQAGLLISAAADYVDDTNAIKTSPRSLVIKKPARKSFERNLSKLRHLPSRFDC